MNHTGNTDLSKPRLNTREAAEYLGLSPSYLEKRRLDGTGPAYLKFGRRVVYELQALDEHAEKNRRRHTCEG